MTIIEDENYSLGWQFQSIKNARRSNVGETVDGNKKKKDAVLGGLVGLAEDDALEYLRDHQQIPPHARSDV